MVRFIHPAKEDITLTGVLGALADPIRLKIFKILMTHTDEEMSCCEAAPCPEIAKSTLSNHFRVLREAGLIHTDKKGVEHQNSIRKEEINSLFPGLLELILGLSD